MSNTTMQIRHAFLDGLLDALDAWEAPNRKYGEREQQAAWRAGHEHIHRLVRQEKARLGRAVDLGEGFP
jgi:hypothetical protein